MIDGGQGCGCGGTESRNDGGAGKEVSIGQMSPFCNRERTSSVL